MMNLSSDAPRSSLVLGSEVCPPAISVIILNYNGARWLERCLGSLEAQTAFDRIEIIVADNASPDGSDRLAAELMRPWSQGKVIQHGANLGYCEGNNRAAKHARGRYLFFLNNDTWLEPKCLESLLAEVEACEATAATPLVLNYDDDSVQSTGAEGFDLFGLTSTAPAPAKACEIFVASGCSLLVQADAFRKVGGFDPQFFMYADEHDLCWRLWLAGGKVILAPSARLHHRGAASVNPKGESRIVEIRTSDSKRFYANRNCLLALLKNSQHLLLLQFPLQLLLLLAEVCVAAVVVRRWSFIKRAYLEAIAGCWKLRDHLRDERQRIHAYRTLSDWQTLRFFRLSLNRWQEIKFIFSYGLPKITEK